MGPDSKVGILEKCFTKPKNNLATLMIWGDSHAQQLNYGLEVGLHRSWNVLQVASSGCKPALPTSNTTSCDKSNTTALASILKNKVDQVLVGYVGMWEPNELERLVKYLRENGVKRVLVAGPVPRWKPSLPWTIALKWGSVPRRTWVGIDRNFVDYNDRFMYGVDFKFDGMVKLDLMSALCSVDGCLTYIGEDIRDGITSFDYGHLMPVASVIVADRVIIPALKRSDTDEGDVYHYDDDHVTNSDARLVTGVIVDAIKMVLEKK